MLHLNSIFEVEGLDPGQIQLIRHVDDSRLHKPVFEFWHNNRREFEAYQSSQPRKNAFNVGGFVASFVSYGTDTLFVGLYRTLSRRQAELGEKDSVLKIPLESTDFIHEMELSEKLREYELRLVIER